MTATCGNQLRK